MRLVTSTLIVVALVVSLVVLTAATASGALPEALFNVTGNTFTASSGEGEFSDPVSGLSIKCKKAKASGELTGPKTGTGIGDFEGCTTAGIGINSLGDKTGIVLIPAAGTLCYINQTKKEVGVLLALPSGGVHLEVPLAGELLVITGSVVGIISPINILTTTGTEQDPKPSVKCEGAADELLFELNENKKPLKAELTRTVNVTFAKDSEVMG